MYSKTASRIYKEAIQEKILFHPIIRPKICTDYTEYVYIINTTDTQTLFERLKKDSRVEYTTWCQGAFDLLIITNERIDITTEKEFKSLILSGERGDYFYSDVKRGDSRSALKEIEEFLKEKSFNSSELTTEKLERGNEWSKREEELYRYLKNNGRRTFIKIQDQLDISRTLLLKCYSRLRKHSLVVVPYFPKGFGEYTKFYILFQTEYEQQAVDLFGKIPCQSTFFKVRDNLVMYVGVEKDLTYEFFILLAEAVSSGFVKDVIHSVPIYYYSRD